MGVSRRWNGLRREIDALRAVFLPTSFHPLGEYPDSRRVQAHTRAFLVLSHAEIESYLESWAKEITRSCESVWKAANRVTKPLAFLLVSISERIEAGQTLSETKGKDMPTRLEESARRLFEKHYTQVKNNHGIKERTSGPFLGH